MKHEDMLIEPDANASSPTAVEASRRLSTPDDLGKWLACKAVRRTRLPYRASLP